MTTAADIEDSPFQNSEAGAEYQKIVAAKNGLRATLSQSMSALQMTLLFDYVKCDYPEKMQSHTDAQISDMVSASDGVAECTAAIVKQAVAYSAIMDLGVTHQQLVGGPFRCVDIPGVDHVDDGVGVFHQSLVAVVFQGIDEASDTTWFGLWRWWCGGARCRFRKPLQHSGSGSGKSIKNDAPKLIKIREHAHNVTNLQLLCLDC